MAKTGFKIFSQMHNVIICSPLSSCLHLLVQMSSSLKERLKKCGRYHPATPPSSRTLSSHSLTASQRQLPRKILIESTHLHENALPTSENRPVNCEASGVKESPKHSFSTTAARYLQTCSPTTTTESSAKDYANGVELSFIKTPDTNVTQSGVKVCSKPIISGKHLPAGDFVELQQHGKSNQNLCNSEKSEAELHTDKKQLQAFLMERKETLRKLHMVKLYRKKVSLKYILIDFLHTWIITE